jgi:hypothetical protein
MAERSAPQDWLLRGGAALVSTKRSRHIHRFQNLRIAKHVGKVWETVEPRWKVSPVGGLEICVQHNDGDGVIVSLQAWMR